VGRVEATPGVEAEAGTGFEGKAEPSVDASTVAGVEAALRDEAGTARSDPTGATLPAPEPGSVPAGVPPAGTGAERPPGFAAAMLDSTAEAASASVPEPSSAPTDSGPRAALLSAGALPMSNGGRPVEVVLAASSRTALESGPLASDVLGDFDESEGLMSLIVARHFGTSPRPSLPPEEPGGIRAAREVTHRQIRTQRARPIQIQSNPNSRQGWVRVGAADQREARPRLRRDHTLTT
jgi:hypothetical protein